MPMRPPAPGARAHHFREGDDVEAARGEAMRARGQALPRARVAVAIAECDDCTWSRTCPTEGEAEAALGVHRLSCPARRRR